MRHQLELRGPIDANRWAQTLSECAMIVATRLEHLRGPKPGSRPTLDIEDGIWAADADLHPFWLPGVAGLDDFETARYDLDGGPIEEVAVACLIAIANRHDGAFVSMGGTPSDWGDAIALAGLRGYSPS